MLLNDIDVFYKYLKMVEFTYSRDAGLVFGYVLSVHSLLSTFFPVHNNVIKCQ